VSAADRLAALDTLPAATLCERTQSALAALADAMNQETVLLRAGRFRDAAPVTARKAALAQDYVGLARAVQRQGPRLGRDAPASLDRLRAGHDSLSTQMAENLRVIATARAVTESLLGDVAASVGEAARVRTYGASGQVGSPPAASARGIALNRAL
jgi:hypothetical protein